MNLAMSPSLAAFHNSFLGRRNQRQAAAPSDMDKRGRTKQWLLSQPNFAHMKVYNNNSQEDLTSSTSPNNNNLACGDVDCAVNGCNGLGTTFPPQAYTLHAFREKLRLMDGHRSTCYSEPDLCPESHHDEGDVDDQEGDADHLFEFDLEEVESNDQDEVGSPVDSSQQLLSKSLEELNVLRHCSDGSGVYSPRSESSPCAHRKFSAPAASSPSLVDNTGSSEAEARSSALHICDTPEVCSDGGGSLNGSTGFMSSVFGSRSSGLGSELRSSQDVDIEVGGMSFEPDQWRDYMQERLSSSEGTVTPEASQRSYEGTSTPIHATSPNPAPPLISPDSLLEYSQKADDKAHHELDARTQAWFKCVKNLGSDSSDPLAEAQPKDSEPEEMGTDESNGGLPDLQELDIDSQSALGYSVEHSSSTATIVADCESSSSSSELQLSETCDELTNHVARDQTNSSNSDEILSDNPSDVERAEGDEDVDKTPTPPEHQPAVGNDDLVPEDRTDVQYDANLKDYSSRENSPLTFTAPASGAEPLISLNEFLMPKQKLEELLLQLEQDKNFPTVCAPTDEAEDRDKKRSGEATPTSGALSANESGSEAIEIENNVSSNSLSVPQSPTSEERPKLRKCSSLKSGRTPPGTPGVRKIVRFADIFGLDLQEVKTFTDEVPRIPRKAFQDLDVDISEFDVGSPRAAPAPISLAGFRAQQTRQTCCPQSTSLVPMFSQPGGSPAFLDVVNERKICLENAFMESATVVVGFVRVINLSYSKTVTVRWTINDWGTYNDLPATYVTPSGAVNLGNTDKFMFRMCLGALPVGSRLQFCLRFTCSGSDYWDNNGSGNYVFQVFPSSNSFSVTDNSFSSSNRGITSPGKPTGSNSSSGPIPIGGRGMPSHIQRAYPTYQASPSIHGDDNWMRFM